MADVPEARPALIDPLVRAMLRPEFYPRRPQRVRLVQTHISWVFLAGDRVYKVKKPADFGFLDFSTLPKRAAACRREVDLNRRLAPGLYLGVAPIYGQRAPGTDLKSRPDRDRGYALTPPGRIVDYAVVMRHLPQERLLSALLAMAGFPQ